MYKCVNFIVQEEFLIKKFTFFFFFLKENTNCFVGIYKSDVCTVRPTHVCARTYAPRTYAHAPWSWIVRAWTRFTVAGESHCRSTAHNYSYAIHQLVFMVKACVLTARYVYLHAHTDTHDGRARSLRMRRRGARLEQGKK